jgi:hypothetical protein
MATIPASRHCEAVRAADRARYQRRHDQHTAWVRRWRAEHRETYRMLTRAHNAVHRALQRGTLIKASTCAFCGGDGYLEAAHTDYTRPLDVLWVCRPCHRQWDHAEPKAWHREGQR